MLAAAPSLFGCLAAILVAWHCQSRAAAAFFYFAAGWLLHGAW